MDSILFLRKFFLHFFPGFCAILVVLVGCQTRSEFQTNSRSAGQYGSENHDAEETTTVVNQVQDTIVYEQPQTQGAYLFAPDEAHKILWGNKGDKPVKATESNVVLLSFIIEPDSTASSVRVLKGFSAEKDSMAVQAVINATWKPGYVKDRPVRSRFAFPVVF